MKNWGYIELDNCIIIMLDICTYYCQDEKLNVFKLISIIFFISNILFRIIVFR